MARMLNAVAAVRRFLGSTENPFYFGTFPGATTFTGSSGVYPGATSYPGATYPAGELYPGRGDDLISNTITPRTLTEAAA